MEGRERATHHSEQEMKDVVFIEIKTSNNHFHDHERVKPWFHWNTPLDVIFHTDHDRSNNVVRLNWQACCLETAEKSSSCDYLVYRTEVVRPEVGQETKNQREEINKPEAFSKFQKRA